MALLEKLKNVGKTVLSKVQAKAEAEADAIYLDDFVADGWVKSDSLPQSNNLFRYRIDEETKEVIIVERAIKTFGHKDKLIRKILWDEIVAFCALKKERKEYSNHSATNYESAFVCTSEEGYTLRQTLHEWTLDSRSNIKEEMEAVVGLNKVLLAFVDMVTDDDTKQWYNEIYTERGTDPVFDESGKLDMKAYVDMHHAWFNIKCEEWQNRMKAVQI